MGQWRPVAQDGAVAVVWALVRTRTRRTLRTTLLLATLAGVVGGIAIAAVAGARRTDTAFTRMSEATRAHDVLVNPDLGIESALSDADVEQLPSVETVGRASGMVVIILDAEGRPDIEHLGEGVTFAAADDHILDDVFRPLVVEGHMPDPEVPTEVLVEDDALERAGMEVGDTFTVALPTFAEVTTWEESGAEGPVPGERLEMRIVGTGTWTNEIVVDEEADLEAVWFTHSLYEGHRDNESFFGLFVRLREGATVDDLRAEIEALVPDEPIEFQRHATIADSVERAVRPQVIAIAAFALCVALAGLLLVGQAISRLLRAEDAEIPALRAAGVTPRQVMGVGVLRAAVVGVVGAVIASVVAIGISPLFPVGVAGPAEPHPGLAVNLSLITLGAVSIVLLLIAWVIGPLWVTSRRAAMVTTLEPARRPSRAARLARQVGAPLPAVAGIRMALERGRGPAATPALSTLAGLVMAVASLVASVVFAVNLQRMIDTPSVWGWTWDLLVGFDEETTSDDFLAAGDHPDVTAASVLTADRVRLEGESLPAIGLEQLRGDLHLTIADGRAPGEDEIALGSRTMDRLDVSIGDAVTARSPDGEERQLEIVGQAVFPGLGTYPGGDRTELGAGVLASVETLDELGEGFGFPYVVFDVREGVDAGAAGPEIIEGLPGADAVDLVVEDEPQRPGDIDGLAQATWVPALLAGVLALMAVVALGHALVTSVRRRRRELAVSKALGFSRRQLAWTVSWQATVMTAAAVVAGLPAGVIVGRWAWIATAEALGIPAEPATPLLAVLLVVPAALLLANLLAWLPARRAARTPAAEVLRSE